MVGSFRMNWMGQVESPACLTVSCIKQLPHTHGHGRHQSREVEATRLSLNG